MLTPISDPTHDGCAPIYAPDGKPTTVDENTESEAADEKEIWVHHHCCVMDKEGNCYRTRHYKDIQTKIYCYEKNLERLGDLNFGEWPSLLDACQSSKKRDRKEDENYGGPEDDNHLSMILEHLVPVSGMPKVAKIPVNVYNFHRGDEEDEDFSGVDSESEEDGDGELASDSEDDRNTEDDEDSSAVDELGDKESEKSDENSSDDYGGNGVFDDDELDFFYRRAIQKMRKDQK